MAHAISYGDDANERGFGGLVARVRKSLADHRLYRKTLVELQRLSDRELSDLGISRFNVGDIARDAVYGR